MSNFDNIKKYNRLWKEGRFTIPVVILIGGAAGTGKSTLASKLVEEISNVNLMGTPIIRTLLKLFVTHSKNPYLYKHTFDLYPGNRKNLKSVKLLEKYYNQQSEPIMEVTEQFLNFLSSEKQNYIIEGSNILPKQYSNHRDIILIEIYMEVSDEKIHRKMFSGPTHNREISDNRFENLRLLHDYVIKQAKKMKKKTIDHDYNYLEVLEYIDKEIGKYLKKYYLVK